MGWQKFWENRPDQAAIQDSFYSLRPKRPENGFQGGEFELPWLGGLPSHCQCPAQDLIEIKL